MQTFYIYLPEKVEIVLRTVSQDNVLRIYVNWS